MRPTPFAKLLHFNLALYFLFIFAREIIHPLAGGALELYEVFGILGFRRHTDVSN
jgi:hypothetical protein